MAKTLEFTYDEFWDAAKKAGLENGFSAADLALAKKNPTAGMQLLQFKINYGNATTDEQRQAANKGAEGVRMQEGGYYGGVTGDDYYVAPNALPTPTVNDGSAKSFGYSDYTKNSMYSAAANSALQNVLGQTPYQSQYANDIAAQKNAILNQSPYASEYKGRLDSVTGDILNAQPFSYDKETDPLYNAYRKQYLREGQRAMADTLGQAAANTGGIASSYAVGAAQQAGNYYNSQLNDKLVDLYNAAYNRYTFDIQNKYNQLNALQSLDNNAYNRYQNDVTNEYNKLNALQSLDNTDYGRYQNDITNKYNQLNAVNSMDNAEYQRMLNEQNAAYQKERDAVKDAQYQQELEAAARQNEATLAWKQQELANSNYQAELDRASKERMNTQDNEYARIMAQEKNGASGTTENGYNGAIKEGVYNDYKAAYPDGAIDNINAYTSLVKQYGLTAVKSAGFRAADNLFDSVTTLGDAEDILDALGIKATLLTEKDWNKGRRKGTQNEDSYEDYLQYQIYRLTN